MKIIMFNRKQIKKLRLRYKIILLYYFAIIIFVLCIAGYWILSYRLQHGWDHWAELVVFIVAISALLYLLLFLARRHNGAFVIERCSAKKANRGDVPNIFKSVESMSLAANLPPPQVYLTHKSIIALTVFQSLKEGILILNPDLISNLKHDELDGIIAHEFSHIAHHDHVIRSILFGSAGFAAGVSLSIARTILYGSSQPHAAEKKNREAFIFRAPLMILFPFLVLFSSVVIILMKLIYTQQEYLADIYSVSLTGKPDALVVALAKLALQSDSPISDRRGFFEDAFSTILKMLDKETIVFEELLNIYPPVLKRISRIKKIAI